MTNSAKTYRSFAVVVAYWLASMAIGCSSTPHSCVTPTVAPPVLVNPSPGATAVSVNVGMLFLDYRAADVVTLKTAAGVAVATASMMPAPSPLPTFLPTPAGVVYGTISIPTLAPMTTYNVVNTESFPGPCGSFTNTGNVGSFTTQ
jgi:hypothetical protein